MISENKWEGNFSGRRETATVADAMKSQASTFWKIWKKYLARKIDFGKYWLWDLRWPMRKEYYNVGKSVEPDFSESRREF